MVYHLLTSLTVCLHFAFLGFVVLGGLLARRYRWIAVPHLLSAAWGIYVEAMPGLRCPLTVWENYFALRAGAAGYKTTFIEHYLLPIIYPDGLSPGAQKGIAVGLVALTVLVYAWPRHDPSRRLTSANRRTWAGRPL